MIITKFKIFEALTTRDELNKPVDVGENNYIEPALMTKDEYIDFLEANGEQHSETAYIFYLSDVDDIDNEVLKNSYKLLNTKKHGKIYVKYYVNNGSKAHQDKYVKHDEEGNILRDEEGNLIYLSEEEKKERKLTYDRDVIAVHNNKIIGSAQDEWGCTLVHVAQEANGLGIGKELIDYYMNYYPNKSSGGTTEAGYRTLLKYYQRQVKLYLRNGIYSDMVKKGDITKDKVREILKSVKGVKYKKHDKDTEYSEYSGLKYNKAVFYGSDIFLINDKIVEFYNKYPESYDYEKFVFAHCRLMLIDDNWRIYFMDAIDVNNLKEIVKYAMSYLKKEYNIEKALYYITDNTKDVTKKGIQKMKVDSDFIIKNIPNDVNRMVIEYAGSHQYYNGMLSQGTRWFNSIDDKYDEIKNKIIENVYSSFD